MPNIQLAIRSEIERVARRAIRAEVAPVRKQIGEYRATIAKLRKELAALHKQVKGSGRRTAEKQSGEVQSEEGGNVARRFSAARLAAHRQKLGLSAADYAKLVGVSSLSIYKWEGGNVRPRAAQIEALSAVRTLSRAQALERLAG